MMVENMEKDIDDYVKVAVLEFLGGNIKIRRSFLTDVEACYYAEPIVYLFQNVSHIFLQIFVGIMSAYGFYLIHGRRKDKKSREELETEIKGILLEHQAEFDRRLKRLEEGFYQLKDKTTAEEIRMNIYSIKAKQLMNPEEATDAIIKLIEVGLKQTPEELRDHLEKLREYS